MTVVFRQLYALWLLALAAPFALALLVAPASIRPAAADCTIAGSTVTCAPPGTGGFVAVVDDLTVTVVPGATVTDSAFRGIEVINGSTVINNGSVIAASNTVFPD